MGMKSDVEIADFRILLKESSIHMIIQIIIWAATIYLIRTFLHEDIVYILSGLLSLIVLIFLITRKVTNPSPITNSWICFICVIFIGSMAGRFIYIEIILPMLIYICVIDIISFTRFGKWTLNAKAINNNNVLPRLLVYGRSFRTGKPIATKGLGDYLWYSIAFSSIYTAYGQTIGLYAIIAIIVGVIVNILLIHRIYKYTWYKGFPATIGPLGLCILLIILSMFLL